MAKPEFDPWPPGQAVYRDLTGAERDGLIELGPVPYGELPATYAEHDIFVFPSASETFGFPLVEAMASGLPVIASDTLTNREICGPAALYYRPFDAGALAERVRELRDRPDLYRWLGEEGVKRARARFDVTQHFDRLLGILDRMQANGTARVQ